MCEIEEIKKILLQHGYEYIKQVGSGAFSTVYLCTSKKYQDIFAIKRTPNNHVAADEHDALIELDHPHIIKIYESFDVEDSNYLVMEYCSNGTIKQKEKLDFKTFVNYAKQILSALEYCHSMNIAHRDIKPDNVFLDKYNFIKLADFGLAKHFDQCQNSHEKCGSLMYCAPEILKGQSFNPFQTDIWSLGITFYYMATGCLPFRNKSIDHLKKVIMMGQIYYGNVDIDPKIQSLISKMTAINPHNRPSAESLLNSPIFSHPSPISKPRALNGLTNLAKTSIFILKPSPVRHQKNRMSLPKVQNLPILHHYDDLKNSSILLHPLEPCMTS